MRLKENIDLWNDISRLTDDRRLMRSRISSLEEIIENLNEEITRLRKVESFLALFLKIFYRIGILFNIFSLISRVDKII